VCFVQSPARKGHGARDGFHRARACTHTDANINNAQTQILTHKPARGCQEARLGASRSSFPKLDESVLARKTSGSVPCLTHSALTDSLHTPITSVLSPMSLSQCVRSSKDRGKEKERAVNGQVRNEVLFHTINYMPIHS
jgi:hypothetical protein